MAAVRHDRSPIHRHLTARKKSSTDWWATYFDAQYLLEYQPLFTPVRDREVVARLIDVLALPSGSRVLDVPCGQGRHAHLLAEAGYRVDGLDYSPHLLARARERGTGPTLRYTRGDMRRLPARWSGRFHAVVCLYTSFGFFTDPSDDARVIREFARVLAPGGTLVWHGGSREHRIRLYTATRLAELCLDAGLVVEEAYDGFTDRPLVRRSGEMMLVARQRELPRRRRAR